jgi:aryl-alcohol dehydrogenase-like predicted oxidoreductase
MNKRNLGRTQLRVSELCLNTAEFAWTNDEADAFALLDIYYAAGGTFIQSVGFCSDGALNCQCGGRVTAARLRASQALENDPTRAEACSCAGDSAGLASCSEDFVGRWHKARGISRDKLVLATRLNLFRPVHGGAIAFANLIRESCEHSLRRLRTDHVDLLVCEWDENLVPVEDAVEAIDMLIRAGLVRHAGAGGFPPWRLVDSLHRSSGRNHGRFEALQSEYSLMTRARFEAEALAMCREHRLGFIARSPLAGGFLARRPVPRRDVINADLWLNERFGNHYGDSVRSVVAEIAAQRLVSPAQIALAWVLRNPHVTSALIAATTPDELGYLLDAVEIRLTDDETGALANVTTVQDYRMELRHA